MFSLLIVNVYSLCLLVFCLLGVHRLWLLWTYFKHQKNGSTAPAQPFETLPTVTIQLPIYNEQYVVPRLIQAVCDIDYPRDRLEIQVLDDSDDETLAIVDQWVEKKRAEGIDIKAIRRPSREGFKAGALQYGLERSRGDLLLIFDADFVPPSNILNKGVHYFNNPQVGMVQFPWGHINRDYSLLTYAQAVLLDGHFNIEHFARSRSGRFFNFNGTAGIWRKCCIADAGGWQGDTLAEDMDLSYRAQLRGWQFEFVPELRVPAELPVELNAFKSQQYRWAKGGAQTALKLLPRILRSRRIPTKVKTEALFHLTANLAYLMMPCLILVFPVLIFSASLVPKMVYALSFITSFLSVTIFYTTAQAESFKHNSKHGFLRSLLMVPILMSVGIGLCINNSRAILEALFSRDSDFVRTPKYNVSKKTDSWKRRKKYRVRINFYFIIEVFFLVYLLWVAAISWIYNAYHLIPFMVLFLLGFSYFAFLTMRQFYIK